MDVWAFKLINGLFLCLFIGCTVSPARAASTPDTAEKTCIKLKSISLDENEILDKNHQDLIFQPYINQCISGELIKAIVTDASNFYINRGYITTRPYLKEQDIADGTLDISILVGVVEDIVNAKTNTSDARIATAFIGQRGEPLNLRDIETSLEAVNRPPSVNAKFTIRPGGKPGESIIAVEEVDTLPYRLSVGVSGERTLEDDNPDLTGTFAVDNLFGINDIFAINLNGSAVQKEFQSTTGIEFNYSFSLGSYLLETALSDSSYRQAVTGINNTFLSTNDTRGLRFKLSKVLARNTNNIYKLSLSVFYKDTENTFANELIEVSSYSTTLVQMDFAHTHLESWGQLTTAYSYYQGVDWFGARGDDFNNAEIDLVNNAQLEFIKHTLDVRLNYTIPKSSYQISASFYAQYTDDILYNNDQLTIGSSYAVRGFQLSRYSGDNGWYLKHDLSRIIALDLHPQWIKTIAPFIGFDYGYIDCEINNRQSCGDISSVTLGIKTYSEGLTTSLVWSRPTPRIAGTLQEEEYLFRFNASWRFL